MIKALERFWSWLRGRRWLLIAAVSFFVLFVAYHAFHMWILRRLLMSAQDDVFLDWTSVTASWPGHVHVRNYRLRFREPDVDVFVALDEADVQVDLFALFKKTFRATKIRGHGLVMRIRPRYWQPGQAGAPAVHPLEPEGLPDIPGLPKAPRPPEEGSVDVPDAQYDKWSVDLADVDVSSIHEVWIERVRLLDAARVVGRLYVRPKRLVSLAPSRLELAAADPSRHQPGSRVHIGGRGIIDPFVGTVSVQIDNHDPRKTEVTHQLSGRAEVRGAIEDLQAWRSLLPARVSEHLFLEGGATQFDVSLGVDHGRLASGLRSDIRIEPMTVTIGSGAKAASTHQKSEPPLPAIITSMPNTRLAIQGAQVKAHSVADDDDMVRFVLSLTGTRAVHLGHPGAADVPQLAIEARVRGVNLTQPAWTKGGVVSVDVPAATLTDVRLIESYLPPSTTLRLLGGSVQVRCRADLGLTESGQALAPIGQAELMTTGDRVRLRLFDSGKTTSERGREAIDLEGKVRSEFQLRGLSLAGAQSIQGQLELTEVHLKTSESQGLLRNQPWWARVQLTKGRLVAADRELPLRIEATAQVRDVRPMLDVFALRGDLPEWVGSVVSLEGLTVGARLSAGPTALDLPILTARSGAWTLSARLWHRNGSTKTIAKVEMGPLALGLQADDAHTGIQLADVSAWFAANEPRF